MVDVRQEAPQDIEAVYEVNKQSFGSTTEADLVNAVRSREKKLISLVAVDGEEIVGHILFSPMAVEDQPSNMSVVGLAPMGVLPTYQNRGIGSKLVRAGLDECHQGGFQIVAVLGHPDYHPRFGFAPSIKYDIKCEFDAPAEVFMVLELHPSALETFRGCTLHYRPEFKDA
jgi:putative acetyltransferase